MFTPQEVSKKTFPETRKRGYDMVSVDEFLDTLTEDYTALYKENAALKTKLKVLAEKVEEYRATEDAMRSTLLTAQKMAAKLVQEAQTEKEAILVEARTQAAKEIAVLDAQKREAEQKLAMAQQNLADFIARSAALCDQQSAFLKSLPELELAVQADESDDKAATVQAIEEEITKEFDPVREAAAPAEEPAVEAVAAQQEEATEAPAGESDNDDAVTDFKLSLNELKFGRNYGSEN
ncbi:MAG: DivIVA domain-containing protein [Oscillospiraceae bacterium]|nr:DivIVA domain-containing protein [Oscillospiraceae bacterium]